MMQMSMRWSTLISSCLHTVMVLLAHVLTLIFVPTTFVNSKTLESDVQVLRSIQMSIDPNSISSTSFIKTWDFSLDPCDTTGSHFLGVLCTVPDDNSSSRITTIDLEGEGLEGFLTPDIGNLTELNELNLSKNKFRGPLSPSILKSRKITRLFLSENFFSGTLSNSFSRLKKLEILDVSQNRLSGSVPVAISGLRSLTHLTLSNNEFSGKIPDLSGLWQLSALDLSRNQLYGNLPMLPMKLRTLLLGHNLLSGHITNIRRLPHIKTLDLSDNRFSGTINQEILAVLPELSHVNFSANSFVSIEVLKNTNRETQLQVLDASNNRLHGHLPLNLITYDNLTAIHLDHNLFSGRIPAEYGKRLGISWRSLFLDYNFLEGSLPAGFISSWGHQVKGSVAHNCLTNCPGNITSCRGGQRPASECVGQKAGDRR